MISDFAVYQIIIFAISIALILRMFVLMLMRKKTIREFFVSVLVWGAFGILGLYPKLSDILAKTTGFALGINALLTFSAIFLLFGWFKQSLVNDRLENSITRVVR